MPNTTNIGIPPYIQQNTSGDTFSNNTFDPETGTEMQAINRKQQIANLLVQQSLAPREGKMIGNVYVGPGIGQGIAQLGQALAGAYMTHRNDKAREGLESQSRQDVTNAMQAYQESQQGRPALTVPDGSQGPERPEMPATPETQRVGLARLMADQHPSVQRFAQFEAQRQAKAAEMQNAAQQALALEAAKAKSAEHLKGVPSIDEQNKLAVHREDRQTIPAVDQAKLAQEAELTAARLAEQARQHNTASGTATQQIAAQQENLAKEQALKRELHNTPDANTQWNTDAQAYRQEKDLEQKQAAMDQQYEKDMANLELERQKVGNTKDVQAKEQAFKERQLTQQAVLDREKMALQTTLHNTPKADTLVNISAQAEQQGRELTQKQAQLDQKKVQDEAELAQKAKQGASQTEIEKARLAMTDRHNKAQEELTRQHNAITKQFHEAQTAKGAAKVDDWKEKERYKQGLKDIAKDDAGVKAVAELEGNLKRWEEVNARVATGPIAGRVHNPFNTDYQELEKLEDKLSMSNLKPGQGAISDTERGLVKGSGPTRTSDEATNRNIINIQKGAVQTLRERAEFIESYFEQHGKTIGADKLWNDYVNKNPRYIQDKKGNVVPNPNRADWTTLLSEGGKAPAPQGGPVQTASAAPVPAAKGGPAVGTVKNGYVFKGGDPASPSSWGKQ